MVALLGRADERIIRAVHPLDHGLEARHVALDQLARRELLAHRGLLHLLAVLVGTGEEEHVVAVEPHEAGDGIGGDRLIGVADMRRAIGIGNGRGQVVAGLVSHRLSASTVAHHASNRPWVVGAKAADRACLPGRHERG